MNLWNSGAKCCVSTDDRYLAFLDLGETMGVERVYLYPLLDSFSNETNITEGFPFAASTQTEVYVRMQLLITAKAKQ